MRAVMSSRDETEQHRHGLGATRGRTCAARARSTERCSERCETGQARPRPACKAKSHVTAESKRASHRPQSMRCHSKFSVTRREILRVASCTMPWRVVALVGPGGTRFSVHCGRE